MTHTQFRNSHSALIANRALVMTSKRITPLHAERVLLRTNGDGAVHTSVEDLLKWDENFYSRAWEQGVPRGNPGARKLNDGKVLEYAKGLFCRIIAAAHGKSRRLVGGIAPSC